MLPNPINPQGLGETGSQARPGPAIIGSRVFRVPGERVPGVPGNMLGIVGALWAPIKIYTFKDFGEVQNPLKSLSPGPGIAQKRSPRAIPNDSRVGQNQTKSKK